MTNFRVNRMNDSLILGMVPQICDPTTKNITDCRDNEFELHVTSN